MCKPQMEPGEDSVEDRLRILEKHDEENSKLLKGIQGGQIAVATGSAVNTGNDNVVKEKKVLDRAVPEDIKRIVANWSRVIAGMENPMKTYLQRAKLSLGNNDTLQIVFDNKQLADKYNSGQSADDLQNVLDNAIGKHVSFETRYIEPQQTFEENYVNLQAINFDIVTEDDEKEN